MSQQSDIRIYTINEVAHILKIDNEKVKALIDSTASPSMHIIPVVNQVKSDDHNIV